MASQVQRSKERIESLTTHIEESHEPLEEMRADLETLLEQRLGVEKELTEAKARVDENEHAMRKLEQERNEKQARQNTLRETLMQYRLKSEGATVKRGALVAQLNEANFELETVISQLPDSLTEAECEQALEKLGNRIQRLGPINLAAIDEYQTQSERKVYLDKQNEDLERALATLQNAIRKIDKETRTRFKETFDKINGGLQSLFPRIFGGGHAYLDMTGEDLLDTGVAIMARPPGKRNSTIHLLSGGEKAMTAIALVFSIFTSTLRLFVCWMRWTRRWTMLMLAVMPIWWRKCRRTCSSFLLPTTRSLWKSPTSCCALPCTKRAFHALLLWTLTKQRSWQRCDLAMSEPIFTKEMYLTVR